MFVNEANNLKFITVGGKYLLRYMYLLHSVLLFILITTCVLCFPNILFQLMVKINKRFISSCTAIWQLPHVFSNRSCFWQKTRFDLHSTSKGGSNAPQNKFQVPEEETFHCACAEDHSFGRADSKCKQDGFDVCAAVSQAQRHSTGWIFIYEFILPSDVCEGEKSLKPTWTMSGHVRFLLAVAN